MMELAGLTQALAVELADRPAIVWRQRTTTWDELGERTRRLANRLHDLGIGLNPERTQAGPWDSPHDHVALYLRNSPAYLEAFLAAHLARAAPFNVNYRYVGRELAHLFGDANPAAIVFGGEFAATLAEVRDELAPTTVLLQVRDDSRAALLPGATWYEAAVAAGSSELLAAASPDDLHLLYTGGTTGMPKGVLWRVDDWMAGSLGVKALDGNPAATIGEAVAAARTASGRVAPLPPLMHGSGTWFAVGGLCRGRTVVIQDRVDRFDPDDVLDVLEREQVTSAMIIGDAFARPLLDALDRRPRDLGALRTILNSGAALHPQVRTRLDAALPGARLVDTIGSSESGPQASSIGEGWYALAADAEVLTPDLDRPLRADETGRGWLAKSGRVPVGYLGDPDKTARTFPTVAGVRYVVPGDLVDKGDGRRVRFLGREATTINTGGEKVFAEEVEEVLRGLDGVEDALVVGRPSARWGQEVVAVVALDPAASPTDAVLRAGCLAGLADYKVPKAFLPVAAVQRLPNGKPDVAWARSVATAG